MGDDPVESIHKVAAVGETKPSPESCEMKPRAIRSEELFAGRKIVLIQHAGEQYRLLVTRNDRLILQK
jgi:hemin uptake protein HemP